MTTTISIVEDDKRFCEVLQKVVREIKNAECISTYANGASAIKNIRYDHPDILILDIQLPDMSGVEVLKSIREQYPDMKIIMFTSFEDDEKIFQSLKAGANGYIVKNESLDNIVRAIEDIEQNGSPLSPQVAQKMITYFHETGQQTKDLDTLSDKEMEILQMLSIGLLYKEIADKRSISIETVKKHCSNIYRKLQVSNKAEAIHKLHHH